VVEQEGTGSGWFDPHPATRNAEPSEEPTPIFDAVVAQVREADGGAAR
jgi:hypothetical protein